VQRIRLFLGVHASPRRQKPLYQFIHLGSAHRVGQDAGKNYNRPKSYYAGLVNMTCILHPREIGPTGPALNADAITDQFASSPVSITVAKAHVRVERVQTVERGGDAPRLDACAHVAHRLLAEGWGTCQQGSEEDGKRTVVCWFVWGSQVLCGNITSGKNKKNDFHFWGNSITLRSFFVRPREVDFIITLAQFYLAPYDHSISIHHHWHPIRSVTHDPDFSDFIDSFCFCIAKTTALQSLLQRHKC